MDKPIYKRVLVKLSGEAMQGKDGIINFDMLEKIANTLKVCTDKGVQVAVVVGAGNIWRGAKQGRNMNRCLADHMGMLATVINALAIKDAVINAGGKATVMTPVDMPQFAELYSDEHAIERLEQGYIVIFGCGTGNPYFSTDTGAVLRAAEIQADIVLMAKNIDGIYDKDPRKYNDAVKYSRLSYSEILDKKLVAYDLTATAFCAANSIRTYAFELKDPENILRVLNGEQIGTETY